MKYLGLDWGEKKIGVATSEGIIAVPIGVVRAIEASALLTKVVSLVGKHAPDEVIIGLSENVSESRTKAFGDKLGAQTKVRITYWDETLSSFDANSLALQSGMTTKRRREMEDAFAAAVILQSYLDSLAR